MRIGNLEILGTSHVSAESVREVEKAITARKPEIVALELDAGRAHALLHGGRSRITLGMIRKIGVKGFVFFAIASFLQRKIGKLVGIEPGSEMKAAITAARKANAKIALIDRSIEITMRRLSQSISWKERLRFVADALSGFFAKGEMKELGSIDLRKIPSKAVIVKVLSKVKAHYPGIYRALVEERNEHMASALIDIMAKNPESKILAVVGAGHEEGLAELLKSKMKKGTTYSFSFE